MKKFILFLFIFSINLVSSAKILGSHDYLILSYGSQISIGSSSSHSFELAYDFNRLSCIKNTKRFIEYYGFGIAYNRNAQFQELGFFTRFNPSHYGLLITRK